MSTESPPSWTQNGSFGAEQSRRMVTSLLARGASVGSIVGGLVGSSDLQVTAGGGMSVNVAPGECWVPGTSSSTQGGYYCRVSASQNLPVAAADPTNPRVDSVTATVSDKAYAGTVDSFVVQVNTGVPTSGATLSNLSGAPALPASSLLLAYVLVPAASSSVTSGDILAKASAFSLSGSALMTSLPTSPDDGQIISLLADASNGVVWQLRYRAASSSAYKWERVGGSAMQAEILTSEASPGASFGDCATVGPSVVLPLAGDYDISFGCQMDTDATIGPSNAAPKLGSATTNMNDSIYSYPSLIMSPARTIRRTGLAAGSTIKLQYKSPGTGTTFGERFIAVTPVRCG